MTAEQALVWIVCGLFIGIAIGKRLHHRLAHLIGWNTGRVETWYDNGVLMVGFRCTTCGRLSGVERARGLNIDKEVAKRMENRKAGG
jgi:hypothetical protein